MSKEKELKAKEVVEQQKKALKSLKKKDVVIEGVSEIEANAIGILLYHIQNNKTQPQANLNEGLKIKKETEEELAFLFDIEKELEKYNKTGKNLRIVKKRIKLYEDNIEKNLNPAIQSLEKHIKFIDDTIEKVSSHITEVEFDDKVVKTYDKDYFSPILDVAYVLFEVKPNE